MYHDVTATMPGDGGGPERFSVPVASFEAMLDAAVARGMAGCSLSEAIEMRGRDRVAITFDDGTLGQFEHAVPALRERGMTATFFVTTDWVGRPGFMSWEQLRRLGEWGMSVQSHSRSHPHLSELDREDLWVEIHDSKSELDRNLRQCTTQLALPGGDRPRRSLRHLLGEAGYSVVATSRWGSNNDSKTAPTGQPVWVRRCTAPRLAAPEIVEKILSGDRLLGVARYAREATLNGIRSMLGAARYHRWRRRVLDAMATNRT